MRDYELELCRRMFNCDDDHLSVILKDYKGIELFQEELLRVCKSDNYFRLMRYYGSGHTIEETMEKFHLSNRRCVFAINRIFEELRESYILKEGLNKGDLTYSEDDNIAYLNLSTKPRNALRRNYRELPTIKQLLHDLDSGVKLIGVGKKGIEEIYNAIDEHINW